MCFLCRSCHKLIEETDSKAPVAEVSQHTYFQSKSLLIWTVELWERLWSTELGRIPTTYLFFVLVVYFMRRVNPVFILIRCAVYILLLDALQAFAYAVYNMKILYIDLPFCAQFPALSAFPVTLWPVLCPGITDFNDLLLWYPRKEWTEWNLLYNWTLQ